MGKGKSKEPKIHLGGLVLYDEPKYRAVNQICFSLIRNEYANLSGAEKTSADRFIGTLNIKPIKTIEEYCDQQESYNQLTFTNEKISCETWLLRWSDDEYYVNVSEYFEQRAKPKVGVMLSLVNKIVNKTYMAYVKRMDGLRLSVDFGYSDGLRPQEGDKLTVNMMPPMFSYNSWNRTINLIRLGDGVSDIVFPKISPSEVSPKEFAEREKALLQSLHFTKSSFNKLQKRAIAGVLLRDTSHIPYILFGPPGTGKTMTLVEAVIQLVRQKPTNRVLICTPSNMAADHFALSLKDTGHVKKTEIFRVYSSTHYPNEKPPEILSITRTEHDPRIGCMMFSIPSIADLVRYRVFVMTLSCSSYCVSARMKGFFSHIIVDEAGQAHEIETLVPICGLGNENTRFVLAGDPKQLGPVEPSRYARKFHLNVSMLERLIHLPIYKGEDARFMCMLCDNYRSHEALVHLPSSMCYGGKLKSAVPVAQCNSLARWQHLPQKGFPMMWHSIRGHEQKEKDGFSYQNTLEAELVLKYVDLLIAEGVKANEIGVVTPYKFQVRYLREQLGLIADELTVDSVQKYQGSERRVIIVSTVRCMELGYMSCCKRLNTIITRAKELLIVVGDHRNMSTDRNWRTLIQYCRKNKGLLDEQNISQKSKTKSIDDLNTMMSSLTIATMPKQPDGAGDKFGKKKQRLKLKQVASSSSVPAAEAPMVAKKKRRTKKVASSSVQAPEVPANEEAGEKAQVKGECHLM